MYVRGSRNSLAPDGAISPRNSVPPEPYNRSARNSLVPETVISKSPRNSLVPDSSRSPRHSLVPDGNMYNSRLSLAAQDYNRSPRNSLVPDTNRSPRPSLTPSESCTWNQKMSPSPEDCVRYAFFRIATWVVAAV